MDAEIAQPLWRALARLVVREPEADDVEEVTLDEDTAGQRLLEAANIGSDDDEDAEPDLDKAVADFDTDDEDMGDDVMIASDDDQDSSDDEGDEGNEG